MDVGAMGDAKCFEETITCDHGCVVLPAVDSTTSTFFNEFLNQGTFSFDDVANMLQGIHGDLN